MYFVFTPGGGYIPKIDYKANILFLLQFKIFSNTDNSKRSIHRFKSNFRYHFANNSIFIHMLLGEQDTEKIQKNLEKECR